MSWRHAFCNGRLLSIPDQQLLCRQREVLADLLSALSAHPAAHGFVRGRSVETALQEHVGCTHLLLLDLANAFPSTTRWHVRTGLLSRGLDSSLVDEVLDTCMEGDTLPVGAPTSPALFNVAMRGIDDAMSELGVYTRYADNLILSGEDTIPSEVMARWIIKANHYRLNESKCRHLVRGRHSLEVFGYVVGENFLRRPRRIRRNKRAEAHQHKGE